MKLLSLTDQISLFYPDLYAEQDRYGTDLLKNNVYHKVNILDYVNFKNKILVDVGAYIGWFSFWAIKQGVSRVIGFEPNLDNYLCLLYNVTTLKLHNIKVFPTALWHTAANLVITNEGPQSRINSLLVVQESNALGSVFDEFKIKNQNLIFKMDIEGHEYSAISGMKDTIKNNNVDFIVCVYHHEDQCKVVRSLLEDLYGKKDVVFDEVGEINGNTALLICKERG